MSAIPSALPSAIHSAVSGRAAELRLAFDRSFADPVRLDTAATQALLAIRVGAEPYAMRLSEIAGLFADKKITQVPGSDAALIGVAGFRGAIVPVYSLQALLGHSSTQTPRWLVIAAAAPVALAFESFEGQLLVSPDVILAAQSRGEMRSFVQEFVRTQNFSGPVMHLPSVLGAVKTRRGEAVPREER
jgi:chemotaxis signal transduction protein